MNILVPLGAFLAAAVGPLAKRVLTSLGIGVISYGIITTIFTQALTYAQTAFTSMPTTILSLAGLAGIGEGMGIIAAAMIFRVTFNSQRKVLGVLNK